MFLGWKNRFFSKNMVGKIAKMAYNQVGKVEY